MRHQQVRVIDYERNLAGRLQPYSKAAILDLDEVEYIEATGIDAWGNCTIVRLRSGKEITVAMPIGYMCDLLCPQEQEDEKT